MQRIKTRYINDIIKPTTKAEPILTTLLMEVIRIFYNKN